MNLRIAHISDLHFTKISWHPKQFLSKQWIGNCNAAFSGSRAFVEKRPFDLIERFLELGVTHVVISGDVSVTSSPAEFQKARAFVNKLEEAGLIPLLIPGNHDTYTKQAERNKEFYRHFPNSALKLDGCAAKELAPGVWAVSLDTTFAAPFYKSTGRFTEQLAIHLENCLDEIPKKDKIVFINHFPLFNNGGSHHRLEGADRLRAVLGNYPNIALYLHGHSHRHCIADLRKNGFPIILDSGSVGLRNGSTWNLIDLDTKACHVHAYRFDEEKGAWKTLKEETFSW